MWLKNSKDIPSIREFNSTSYKSYLLSLGLKLSVSFITIVGSAFLMVGCNEQPVDVLVTTPNIDDPIEIVYETLDNVSPKLYNNSDSVSLPISCRNNLIVNAYDIKQSSVQIKGCGKVKAILDDDIEGSRHQRFIVLLEDTHPQHTILIAHNIDLAPRVKGLQEGDTVTFYGEYEYNPQGGVVHWTHHDPAARHQNGWIEHKGKRYL